MTDPVLASRMSIILSRYVDADGNINYKRLPVEEVAASVSDLKDFDIHALNSRNERITFWINTYNLLAIYGVLSQLKDKPDFGRNGLKGIRQKVSFFSINKYVIAGAMYSLNRIENQILRKGIKEPRIHFALVCGASSCPILKDGLYSSDNLDSELDVATGLFVNNSGGVQLDKDNEVIRLSKIFKWYRKDFGGDKISVLNFIARYHDEGVYIKENARALRIEYLNYDWEISGI